MKKDFAKADFKHEISLFELTELIVSKLLTIVAGGVVAALVMGICTKFLMTPTYKTNATMYLYTSMQTTQLGAVNNSDLVAASSLAETFRHILSSNQVADSALDFVKESNSTAHELTADNLKKMISVSKIDGTQLIEIQVVSESPKLAKVIAEAYCKAASDEFTRITKVGGVEIVNYPEIPTAPYSPSLIKNCIVGFLAGGVILTLIIIAKYMSDTTIYTAEEIKRISQLPVIGTVPSIDGSEKKTAFTWSVKERREFNANKENQ